MDALPPDPLRLDARDLVVRERVGGHLALALVMGAVALGWSVGPWVLGRGAFWVPALISGLLGLPLLAIAAVMLRGCLRGLRRGRWTLRLGAEALWLCPRSFFNEAPGRPPPAWVRLPLDEVRAARPGEQRAHVPDGDGGRTRVTDRWLDLDLARTPPEAVRRAIDDERRPYGGVRTLSFPLEWRGERTLRVYWQTTGVLLAPRRERLLAELARRVPVHPAGAPSELDCDALEEPQVEALARDLHARGHLFDAVRLLREKRGWSLAHARTWLREGEGGQDAA